MKSEFKLLTGAMVMLSLSTSALVVVPYLQVRDIAPAEGLKPYTSAQLRGREVYIANGCVYCHTQQPRAQGFGPDLARGWGRATVAADYAYDRPHLLGTMRTGPDLQNVGARLPSEAWHMTHLYQPRAIAQASAHCARWCIRSRITSSGASATGAPALTMRARITATTAAGIWRAS